MKTIKNLAVKAAALLSAFSLTLISVPQVSFTAFAEDAVSVRVIVENTTFTEAIDGAEPVWTGTKIDKWVELDESDDAMSCIKKAIDSEGLTQTGAEYGYITEIAGLSAYDGGYMSGWMGTLNDWFTDEAFTAYTVANGKLADGDEIRMQYSLDWGADLGYDWSGTDTSLKAIECTEGTLSPDFSPSVYEYTLTVPFGTESINFRPTALNKNFKVISTIGEKTLKLTRPTEISDNDVITVTVGTGAAASQYKITVKQGERPAPRFESLAFSAYALDGWDNSAFSPEQLEYDVRIKNYNTSTVSLTSSTKYDDKLLKAVAVYTDAGGSEQNIEIKSGAFSYLTNISFGSSTVVIELRYKDDDSIKTQYKFNFTRPYDYTAEFAANTGITVVPTGREIYTAKYNGFAEGTVLRNDEYGSVTEVTGTSSDCSSYTAYIFGDTESVSLSLKGKTANVHMRTKAGGEYTETFSGATPAYSFDDDGTVTITIQTVSDGDYIESGFDNADKIKEYSIKLIKADVSITDVQLIDMNSDYGDFYPSFDPLFTSYNLVIANDADYPTVSFKAAEGCTVIIGGETATADENGWYSIETSASNKTITLTNGSLSNSYTIKSTKKSKYAVPDKVTDYLCINSAYTNASYGVSPEATLSGSLKSLGNFGGYITYYYEEPITDDPANAYGLDFYAYGNSFASGGSAAENGQVYVSEDGEKWYALAGSEHFEDTTITDYEVTYTKTADGKTSWADNQGNSNDGKSMTGKWVSPSIYYMNDLAKGDTITLRGVLIPSIQGSICGDSTTSSFAGTVKFGYVDYFKNGTIGADVNAYTEGAQSNGFDLKWAVDEDGNPVSFDNGVHYIRIQTASNIWAGAFGEKSTEVTYVVKTTAKEEETGTASLPEKIVITDESGNTIKEITPDNNGVYEVQTGIDDYIGVTVSAADDDNIYINNSRVLSGDTKEITVNQSKVKTVRIIVQNGEKQPVYVYLKLIPDDVTAANQVTELIDAIGIVTLDSYDCIEAAREAYDRLNDNAKALVENYDMLINAEAALAKAEDDVIKAAEEAIDSIGRVTAYSGEAIDTAREAYNKVPDRIKYRVNNADILVSSEERYAEIIAIKTAGADSSAHYAAVLEALSKNEIYPIQPIGGEWTVIALARAGALSGETAEKYYNSLCAAVEEIGSARLSERKPSENARVIIALAAIGKDPSDVAGYDLLCALDDMEYIEKQGINAAIYALIAFDCTDYDAYIHDELIEYILANMTGGGWALAGDTADVDVTAMAIQALAPYIDDEEVSTAVESGLLFLSDSLDENCGYGSCESTSQTLIALAALGIDPISDERFIVDGITLTDALEVYAAESGYKHIVDGEENLMATEQAALALTAYGLSKDGSSLYDLSAQTGTGDKPLPGGIVNPGDSSGTPTDKDDTENPDTGVALTGGMTVLLSGIAMLISGKKRKQK